MARTALIVGAGIGGLSAGIALRKADWDVRIFERFPSARELGFGLGLAPNAMAALSELGVADVVLARGVEPTRAEARRMDGTVLKRLEIPRRLLGGPMVLTLRPALHGALIGADGVHSVIRRQLHPSEGPPRSSRIVSVRGVVDGLRRPRTGIPDVPCQAADEALRASQSQSGNGHERASLERTAMKPRSENVQPMMRLENRVQEAGPDVHAIEDVQSQP